MNERMNYVVRPAFGGAWHIDEQTRQREQRELIARVNAYFATPPRPPVPKGVWSGG